MSTNTVEVITVGIHGAPGANGAAGISGAPGATGAQGPPGVGFEFNEWTIEEDEPNNKLVVTGPQDGALQVPTILIIGDSELRNSAGTINLTGNLSVAAGNVSIDGGKLQTASTVEIGIGTYTGKAMPIYDMSGTLLGYALLYADDS